MKQRYFPLVEIAVFLFFRFDQCIVGLHLTMSRSQKHSKAQSTKGRMSFSGQERKPLRTLLIDNYDSYTYNLYQLISKVNGVAPCVVYNDAFNSKLPPLLDELGEFDNVVLSPGPGRPDRSSDFGICGEVLRSWNIPVLGVCLGHQGIGHFSGGKVVHAPEAMHGRYSKVYHNNQDLFEGLPQGFEVVRYHSLAVCPNTLPDSLSPSAWTFGSDTQGVLMGVTHKTEPLWGVQFHPESIGTQYGHKIVDNFNALTRQWKQQNGFPFCNPELGPSPDLGSIVRYPESVETQPPVSKVFFSRSGNSKSSALFPNKDNLPEQEAEITPQVVSLKLEFDQGLCPSVEMVFEAFYSNSTTSFWLDSCGDLRPQDLTPPPRRKGTKTENNGKGRFSYMGSFDGDFGRGSLGTLIEYYGGGKLKITDSSGKPKVQERSLFGYLKQFTSSWKSQLDTYAIQNGDVNQMPTKGSLPFDFKGGLVGFLGYEMRHDAAKVLAGVSGDHWNPNYEVYSDEDWDQNQKGEVPEAFFMFADRLMVYDHQEHDIHLVAVERGADGKLEDETKHWFEAAKDKVHSLVSEVTNSVQKPSDPQALKQKLEKALLPDTSKVNAEKSKWHPTRPRSTYYNNVVKAQKLINEGETYEVCLTNQLVRGHDRSSAPLDLYLKLRRSNPAHYASFLTYDPQKQLVSGNQTDKKQASFAVLCSSPERFLRIDNKKIVESQPIKGTAKRGTNNVEDQAIIAELANCEKNQAENLMIVDLVRNDLGRVCKIGSVTVPRLMHVESYATVHQLVSTIQGELAPGCDVIDAIVASFPGGSMTGAPKIRTMEVIDELEESFPRGIYSGSLGYISVDGTANLNIVIRTAVMTPSNISVGAGGAIIALSETEGEYEEMMLKANSVLSPLAEAFVKNSVEPPSMLEHKTSSKTPRPLVRAYTSECSPGLKDQQPLVAEMDKNKPIQDSPVRQVFNSTNYDSR